MNLCDLNFYRQSRCKIEDGVDIYYEESGNENGIPVFYFHGGPAGGCKDNHRDNFDPSVYRVILFDQRGANRSFSKDVLYNNTTQDLVSDIEHLRLHLNIEKFVIFGSSWGSTLALCYSIMYPHRVITLILKSIFLGTQYELDWIYGNAGVRRIFPREWSQLERHIPNRVLNDMQHFKIYDYSFIFNSEGDLNLKFKDFIQAWMQWENTVMTYPSVKTNPEDGDDFTITIPFMNMIKIVIHYLKNKFFLPDLYIFNHIKVIQDIPCFILHGASDMLTPLYSAWKLSQSLPSSHLNIIQGVGHYFGTHKKAQEKVLSICKQVADFAS